MNTTRKISLNVLVATVLSMTLGAGVASATAIGGIFFTDRFGYTGTVVQYLTEADARNGVNAQATVNIGDDGTPNNNHEHRDIELSFAHNAAGFTGSPERNIMLGSWWYTTVGPGRGVGNLHGNTGVGFMQLFDSNGDTDSSVTMGFQNFDGTHWTEFQLNVQGTNALPGADSSRFSVFSNAGDGGTYLEYALGVTATGLLGVRSGDNIEATNHPTGVSGGFEALFRINGGSQAGFYTIDLTFDMQNWAYDNRNSLTGPNSNFANSRFFAIQPAPEPATLVLVGLGLAGLAAGRRRGKA